MVHVSPWGAAGCQPAKCRLQFQTLVAVLAQLELTSHQREISSVSSPKWQTFISSRLTLSGFKTLKEPLLNQKAFSSLMGLTVASWEQQLGEESSNWENRAQLVPLGTGLFGGTAATPSAWQWTRLAGPHEGMCCFCPSASCSIPPGPAAGNQV